MRCRSNGIRGESDFIEKGSLTMRKKLPRSLPRGNTGRRTQIIGREKIEKGNRGNRRKSLKGPPGYII